MFHSFNEAAIDHDEPQIQDLLYPNQTRPTTRWSTPYDVARDSALVGHHWQNVSRAWLLISKHEQALDALNRARHALPQQTRLHPWVRETVYGIAAVQRRQSNSLTGFAAWLGVQL